jgi:hypothetical protein
MSFDQLKRGFDSLPADVRVNGQTESFALASGVVRAFLGNEWAERHIISDHYPKGVLSIKHTTEDPYLREVSFFRIMDLAEVLYNLQTVPAFDECIERMRAGDLEGTFAESDFGLSSGPGTEFPRHGNNDLLPAFRTRQMSYGFPNHFDSYFARATLARASLAQAFV